MYAKVLADPDYFRELEKEELAVRQYYKETYELYKSGNNNEVISRTEHALRTYPGHTLIPQFEYLGILANGKISDRKVFRDNLLAIIAKYPDTEIAGDAQNLINYMDKEHPEIKEAEEFKISKQLYQQSSDSTHYFGFVLDKKINTNQLVFNIINFNLDHFDNLNLMVEIISLNANQQLILVKTFRNPQLVMQYLHAISSSSEILKDMPDVSMIPLAISKQNLKTLQEDKSVDRYLKFYNDNYR